MKPHLVIVLYPKHLEFRGQNCENVWEGSDPTPNGVARAERIEYLCNYFKNLNPTATVAIVLG